MTPGEISISILAELIASRRRETMWRSKSAGLVAENIDLKVLRFLADPKEKKALLLVFETNGSTPVKSGAMMAVGRDLRTAGTIGGGCSEDAVLRDAWRLIGTGGQQSVTVDMSNDVAEEEGMVCGGSMRIWITDVPD